MTIRIVLVTSLLALVGLACDTAPDEDAVPLDETVEGVEMEAAVASLEGQVFTAELSPVNEALLDGTPSGEARLEVQGDSLVITVNAQGLPPDMMHLQHFHGFEDGSTARCPTADADENGDGVVDVTETAPMAGTTMVPFHDDPANMEIQAETYPRADQDGAYSYRQTVALESVRSAFEEKFGGDLALHERVVFIHGVPEDVELPETADTKAGLPAHVALPIACGELRAMGEGGDGGS